MIQKKVKLVALLLLVIGLSGLKAQESITASGGNASGSGGFSSYSVGQVVYTSNTGTNGSVAQGVQQPYEISVIIGLEEDKSILLHCSVYPNPTTDFLTLSVDNLKHSNLSYQLFDINGSLLESKKMESNEARIILKDFISAIYFLKVTEENKEVKTFKIIKN